MKRCSTSRAVRKIKIKARRYHFYPVYWQDLKRLVTFGRSTRKYALLHTAGRSVNLYNFISRENWVLYLTLKTVLMTQQIQLLVCYTKMKHQ